MVAVFSDTQPLIVFRAWSDAPLKSTAANGGSFPPARSTTAAWYEAFGWIVLSVHTRFATTSSAPFPRAAVHPAASAFRAATNAAPSPSPNARASSCFVSPRAPR